MSIVWTAWNNGKHAESGAGYGFKVPIRDRDKFFCRGWPSVVIELPVSKSYIEAEINISKASFWNQTCHELVSKTIGQWLIRMNVAPWPLRSPPKFVIEQVSERRFRIVKVLP